MADNTPPPISQQQAAPQMVNVVDPDTGQLGSIPSHQLEEASAQGFTVAPQEMVEKHFKEEKYGSAGQQALAGIEGVAKGVAGPLATAGERAIGVSPEDIEGRAEVNPVTHGAGEIAGLVAPAVLSGGESLAAKATLGGVMSTGAEAAVKAAGLGAAESTVAKIGSAAVRGAVDNMIFQGSDEASKIILDPKKGVQTGALVDVGLAGLIGAGAGGALGAVSPMWRATMGGKVGGLLHAVTEKMGGRDGVIPDAMNDALNKAGIDMAPEIRAGLSNDPSVQNAFKTLEQTDTAKSGLAFQETYKKAQNQLGDALIENLGRKADEITPELSQYEAGKKIGNALADEYHAKVSPLSKEYDDLSSQYKKAPLSPSVVDKSEDTALKAEKLSAQLEKLNAKAEKALAANSPETALEISAKMQDLTRELQQTKAYAAKRGTTDILSDKIASIADKEGWTASPSSDIMKEVNRVLKELPMQKTVGDLSNYIKAVGDNMQSDPLNGPLRRAGGIIKGALRDAESDIIGTHLGSEHGAEAIERYAAVRKAYAEQSQLREALDSRLHAKGSTSGYAKSLREMAQTDGEAVLRRLSGKGDADLLQVLQTNFPNTAQLVKDYHLDNLVKTAMDKAKAGDKISSTHLVSAIDKLSPELRNFAIPKESQDKIKAIGSILDQFHAMPHNFSNTARTLDKLTAGLPGSALSLAALMTGHNPIASLLIKPLVDYVGKEVPAAIKLSVLKFLGSTNHIDAGGFKAMAEFVHSAAKGENLASKAAKNLFKAESEVIPEHMMPTESDRAKLDKTLQAAQKDPMMLEKVGGSVGHYMPEHGQEIAHTTSNAVQYLNSIRPQSVRANPLDAKIAPSSTEKAAFDRALDIAQQPLVVLQHIQKGTLTPKDIEHLQILYPDFYSHMTEKLTHEMMNSVSKGEVIPYKVRMGLSQFLGQPMDSTMTPAGIMGAQPKPQEPTHEQESMSPSAAKASGLNKLSQSYQTPSQSSAERKAKGKN